MAEKHIEFNLIQLIHVLLHQRNRIVLVFQRNDKLNIATVLISPSTKIFGSTLNVLHVLNIGRPDVNFLKAGGSWQLVQNM